MTYVSDTFTDYQRQVYLIKQVWMNKIEVFDTLYDFTKQQHDQKDHAKKIIQHSIHYPCKYFTASVQKYAYF